MVNCIIEPGLIHLSELTMDILDVQDLIDQRTDFLEENKGEYQRHIEELIEKAEKEGDSQEDIQQFLLGEFKKYGLLTKVSLLYKYCDREENRKRGRVGQIAGWRQATISFQFIPDNQIPSNHIPSDRVTRYFDLGRLGWRSFRNDCFVVIAAFWNEQTNNWVDKPSELPEGLKNVNWKYKKINRPDTPEEKTKKEKVAKKEEEKREKEIAKTSKKLEKLSKSEAQEIEPYIHDTDQFDDCPQWIYELNVRYLELLQSREILQKCLIQELGKIEKGEEGSRVLEFKKSYDLAKGKVLEFEEHLNTILEIYFQQEE